MHPVFAIEALTGASPAVAPAWQLWWAKFSVWLLEGVAVAVVVAMALWRRQSGPPPTILLAGERWFAKLARRKALSVVSVGVFVLSAPGGSDSGPRCFRTSRP